MRIARSFWNLILRSVAVNHASKASVNGHDQHIDGPRELVGARLENPEGSIASRPIRRLLEESTFVRQADYWTIRYQGQTAILKATRGLDYLGYLLRHPRLEIHVTELLATLIAVRPTAMLGSLREAGGDAVTAGLQDAGPILDYRAKVEYRHRIYELQKDLEEAERFNDSYRAAAARSEMDAIAEQVAAAVGLGGRDRRASAGAERARSAVTKRIKQAIDRIGEVMPPLGHHLAARIKTGYFCSYNPHPDRSVAWKF